MYNNIETRKKKAITISSFKKAIYCGEAVRVNKIVNDLKNGLIYLMLFAIACLSIVAITINKKNESLMVTYNTINKDYNDLSGEYSTLEESAESTLNIYNELSTNYESLKSNYSILETDYNSLLSVNSELDTQNKELATANDEYYDQLQDYKAREELYNKYEYAIYNDSGERTDISYDQLKTAEELMKAEGFNDAKLLFAMIMTESGGDAEAQNPSSSAKGYGQLINGTAKVCYEDFLGNGSGTYSSDMALNGDTNIEMMVAYLAYLKDTNNGNVDSMINDYRGLNSSGYKSKINSYLTQVGTSIDDITCQLQS